MTHHIGISGWRYAPWRGDFYPEGLPQRRELEYAASKLTSIEVNGSFYSLQRPTSWEKWRSEMPDDFLFSVKGGRFITHMKRLQDVEVPLANFFAQGVLALGPKLGPILWQLPATFAYDESVLTDFCALLPRTTTEAASLATKHDDKVSGDKLWSGEVEERPIHHALEPRHMSFASDEALAHLDSCEMALVVADSAGKWPRFEQAVVRSSTHGCTATRSSTPAATPTSRWTAGPSSCGAGRRTAAIPTCTSTTTSRGTRRTTRCG